MASAMGLPLVGGTLSLWELLLSTGKTFILPIQLEWVLDKYQSKSECSSPNIGGTHRGRVSLFNAAVWSIQRHMLNCFEVEFFPFSICTLVSKPNVLARFREIVIFLNKKAIYLPHPSGLGFQIEI